MLQWLQRLMGSCRCCWGVPGSSVKQQPVPSSQETVLIVREHKQDTVLHQLYYSVLRTTHVSHIVCFEDASGAKGGREALLPCLSKISFGTELCHFAPEGQNGKASKVTLSIWGPQSPACFGKVCIVEGTAPRSLAASLAKRNSKDLNHFAVRFKLRLW